MSVMGREQRKIVREVAECRRVAQLHSLIRGKNILWDYKKHYLDYDPYVYKGKPCFDRHNHEFTRGELRALAERCGFEVERLRYIRSRRYRKEGLRRVEIPFTALRDFIPFFRKGIMLTARKVPA